MNAFAINTRVCSAFLWFLIAAIPVINHEGTLFDAAVGGVSYEHKEVKLTVVCLRNRHGGDSVDDREPANIAV